MKLIPLYESVEFDTIVSGLYNMSSKIQFCHHSTKNEPVHQALGAAYEKIEELKDSIIEKITGYSGERLDKIEKQEYSGYSESMNMEAAKDIIDFAKDIIKFGEDNDYPDIENLGQEYSGAGAQLSYLLSMDL